MQYLSDTTNTFHTPNDHACLRPQVYVFDTLLNTFTCRSLLEPTQMLYMCVFGLGCLQITSHPAPSKQVQL